MPASKFIYSVHPGVPMTRKSVGTLKEKTGRSLDEWLRLVKKPRAATEEERRETVAARRVRSRRLIGAS